MLRSRTCEFSIVPKVTVPCWLCPDHKPSSSSLCNRVLPRFKGIFLLKYIFSFFALAGTRKWEPAMGREKGWHIFPFPFSNGALFLFCCSRPLQASVVLCEPPSPQCQSLPRLPGGWLRAKALKHTKKEGGYVEESSSLFSCSP